MDIDGYWYEAQQSKQQTVILRLSEAGLVDVLATNARAKPLLSCQVQQLSFSPRLGNSTRYAYFPDGQKFETSNNDAIDSIAQQYTRNASQWLYRLETHWRYVIVALLILGASVTWFAKYGVPMSAKAIAMATPQSWVNQAGEQTLNFFDEKFTQPSMLDESVRKRVAEHFDPIIQAHPHLNLQLLFRDSDIGANAFALPNGIIIFTDDMIMAAKDDDELLSVMAHEIAHIHYRHGMRGVIQSSLIGFGFMLLAGDVSGAAEIFLGIPVLLTHLGYSRDFEREADDYALAYMLENNIDPAHFSRLMMRISQSECVISDSKPTPPDCFGRSMTQRYLSTHPGLDERVKKFDPAN